MRPFAKEEGRWLKQLEEVGRNALLPQPDVRVGGREPRFGIHTLGGLLTLFFVSVVGVAGGMWFFLKRSKGGSHGQVPPKVGKGEKTPGSVP